MGIYYHGGMLIKDKKIERCFKMFMLVEDG